MIDIKKLVTSCLLSLLLIMGMAAPAYALDLDLSHARIDAHDGGLYVEKSAGPYHFIKEEGLAPGTTITRSYLIENTHSHDYDLWLYAENPSDNLNGNGLVKMVYLKLYLDGEKIYDGNMAGALDQDGKTMENDISFGTIRRNSSTKLTAVFTIPGEELGNEYQGASAEVDWVFKASRAPVDTPDPNIPVLPKTGDTIKIGSLFGFLLMSIILLLYAKRRHKRLMSKGDSPQIMQ